MSVTALRGNRDFVLLQAGQLLSSLGGQTTAIAYTLLTLRLTHSPAKAGLVTFAQILPFALFGVLGGVLADRVNRKSLMIAADAGRGIAVGALAFAIVSGSIAYWHIVAAAAVEGACSVFFSPAASGALRSVVPSAQLPAAAGVQQARGATVSLVGPPLGGALFGIGRALPFVLDAISYVGSIVFLLAMRTPFQAERRSDAMLIRHRLAEGFRFLWRQPFLRVTAFLYGLSNFIGPGILLVLVVVAKHDGLSGGATGLLLALFGAATLTGALVSPAVRRALSTRAIMLLELWTWVGSAAFVIWPNVYVLTAALVVSGLAIPITDSVVIGFRLAITPERLVGRVESVRSTIALLLAPLGPLCAGVMLSTTSARATVALFAATGLVLALWGTLSPAIRRAPALSSLEQTDAGGGATDA